MNYKLLMIDDDQALLEVNTSFFQSLGYEVCCSQNAEDALCLVQQTTFDCILLDVMLPDLDGIDACVKLRYYSGAPIIFLSGKNGEEDKIRGLLSGGDDYISKPYSLYELHARIIAHIRRTKEHEKHILDYPPLHIDLLHHIVTFNELELFLTSKEYDLLVYLATHPWQTISYDEILNTVWHTDYTEDRRGVMVHISRLRKKLELENNTYDFIHSVYGVGYIFTPYTLPHQIKP